MSRHSDTARANRLRRFGVVAWLAWLNLAMLPCTMAASDAPGCPECPPEASGQHAGHAMHGDDEHTGHSGHHGQQPAHADHGKAGDGPHCGVVEPDCCELDELRLDDRSQKLERDAGAFVLAEISVDGWHAAGQAQSLDGSTGPPRRSTGAVRLHAFNCVYRD